MLDAILYLIYIFILSVIISYFLLIPDPPPLCGVYSQPGKFFWLKYGLFRIMYWLRQKQKGNEKKQAGYGVKSKTDIKEMERVQKLLESAPFAVDAVYFNASDRDGGYFVAANARRHEMVSQIVLMIMLPEIGLLELPCAPDTHLKRTDEDKKGQFGAGGLTIEPLDPMKRWRIRFQGKLKLDRDQHALKDAKLSLDWTACSDHFDFDTDMNAHALATSISREPWSREFFNRLRDSHQTHYEQFGDIRGTLSMEGKEYVLNMRGVRDHSYGNVRCWTYFHRYAMQMVHLKDGTCFNAAIVSMPNVTMSRLEFGYLFKNGKKLALRRVDLPLHKLGETTKPPMHYEFQFEDEEDQIYSVECEVVHRPEFYLGHDGKREAMILEQMCKYKVNDQLGWGFSEWQYRHLDYNQPKCHN